MNEDDLEEFVKLNKKKKRKRKRQMRKMIIEKLNKLPDLPDCFRYFNVSNEQPFTMQIFSNGENRLSLKI